MARARQPARTGRPDHRDRNVRAGRRRPELPRGGRGRGTGRVVHDRVDHHLSGRAAGLRTPRCRQPGLRHAQGRTHRRRPGRLLHDSLRDRAVRGGRAAGPAANDHSSRVAGQLPGGVADLGGRRPVHQLRQRLVAQEHAGAGKAANDLGRARGVRAVLTRGGARTAGRGAAAARRRSTRRSWRPWSAAVLSWLAVLLRGPSRLPSRCPS